MVRKKTATKKSNARKSSGPAKPVSRKKSTSKKKVIVAEEASQPGFPIVGIGASAGGLDAIRELFRYMPADIGMAFVVVQHLDPHHKSILTELIDRVANMPVVEATQGLRVEPDNIYVIPPKHDLAILNGVLQLMEPGAPRHLRLSIDYFFRSLARDQGANAFCIVLSGAGSDGTLGLREIKGEGGVALVQTPDTAGYDSMPSHADATGLADVVLPPREMGAWLQSYGRHLLIPGKSDMVREELHGSGKSDRLFVLVRNRTGYDFSQYKEGTVSRRIERRMVVNGVETLEDYISLLHQVPAEVDRLWKEFLIRVTNFFRNPNAFTALGEKVIPGLFENRPNHEPIRVWVPACSTGEEAYTIAMLIQAELDRLGRSHGVQIFATDIDEEALDIARTGVYPNTIAADIPANYLRRYFLKHQNGFQLVKSVRSLLVFSRHDITRDPPFSRMDLVSCRNLLIYMQPQLQTQVMDALSYALKSDAVLFLGNSESLGKFTDLYEAVDARAKIFRRRGMTPRTVRSVQQALPRLRLRGVTETQDSTLGPGVDLKKLAQQTLMSEYTPACAVIDNHNQILYIHGHTGRYLEPAIGHASMDILKMAREGLRTELASAIRDAGNKQELKRFERLRVKDHDTVRLVHLTVRPLPGTSAESRTLMVMFEDGGPTPVPAEVSSDTSGSELADHVRVAWLEQELADTRETLQNANEELETSNEELQCTVEELQSSNEELMTSQEELSSINEELQTVNVELEDKVQQLEETGNDLENLLVSTELGTVFLDLDLNVRRFTPSALKVINLIETDIGRPLAHIVHKLDYQGMIADAENVLDTLQPKVLDVRTKDDKWYSLRITLYRTGNNAIDGVVLTFVDLTERIMLEKRFHDLMELAPDAMVITNESGEIVQANMQAESLLGYASNELFGLPVESLLPERLRANHENHRYAYQRNPRTRAMGEANQQLAALRKDGSEFPADISIGPIQTTEGQLYVATIRNVSERHRTEAILERTNKMFHEFCHWNQARFLSDEPPADALKELCRRLVQEVGYRQCWIGLGDESVDGVAHFGFSPDGTEIDVALLDPGQGPDPRVIYDMQAKDLPRRLRAQAKSWRCNAILSAPMMAGERRIGLLVITANEQNAFPQQEVVLWKTLSTSLGVMLSLLPGDSNNPLGQS